MQYAQLLLVSVCCVVSSSYGVSYTNLANTDCGVVSKAGRIVNGLDAAEGEFPWTVSLKLRGVHYCGGTLIHSRWVLTAAHCFYKKEHNLFQATVAEHDLTGKSGSKDSPAVKENIGISQVLLHPEYQYRQVNNDIALLKLDKDVQWGSYVRPACLSTTDKDLVDRMATVAGWGYLDEFGKGGVPAKTLQKVDVPVIANDICQSWYKDQGKKVVIADSAICAGFKAGGKDACQADSGGPLMVKEGNKHVLVGVVAAGIGCARPSLPGLYTRVTSHIAWIRENIQA